MTTVDNAQKQSVSYDVTCILISYNQQDYIEQALEGLLNAETGDYSVEYILSDDGSTDDTSGIMHRYLEKHGYIDKDNINFIRNDPNLGLIKHLNNVFSLSQGRIFILCAGDDVCGADRIIETMKVFQENDVSLVNSDAFVIDQIGRRTGRLYGRKKSPPTLKDIFKSGHVNLPGAGNAIHRDVFHAFGELPDDVENEDDQLPVRALLLKGIGIVNKPIFSYRMHSTSLSSWLWRSESTIMKRYLRYVKNFTNRYRHYSHWLKKSQERQLCAETIALIKKRVQCFRILSETESFGARLVALKYWSYLDASDRRVITLGVLGVWLNNVVSKFKWLVKLVVGKMRT